MGYLYEAMDSAKEAIRAYYADKGDEGFDVEVMDGFFTCVERMVSSEQEREEISKEMEVYRMGGGTFGFNVAIKNRTTKMPDAWWTSCGARVHHLQKLSIRVLNQTCSSFGLESQRLNDMVYVYYNLRLWVRQLQKPTDVDAISLDNIDTTSSWRVETERPIMDSIPDWLGVDLEDVAVAGEGEPEVEEEEQH
eukprot:PITA_26084